MGKYANKVVEQAKAWLGKNEADGSHKEIIDVYNAHKPLARGYKVTYKDPWCATFVSAVAVKLGYTGIIPTECSCSRMIDLFKGMGAWDESDARTPAPGDILFYDWDDNGAGDNRNLPDHVGIVEEVSDSEITVIEGNYNNAVGRRTLEINGRYIRGYGVPKYDKEVAAPPKSVDELAREVIAGKYGVGTDRRQRLQDEGHDPDAVQARVNEILAGKTSAPQKTIDELAREVIAGKHGSGAARKKSLGDQYDAVQKRVNELLRK